MSDVNNKDELDYFEKKDLEKEFEPNKSVGIVVISIGLVAIACLWATIYIFYSNVLNEKVDNMKPVIDAEVTVDNIAEVTVHLNDEVITLQNLTEYENLPTIVDVEVVYEDGSISNKQAYVVLNADEEVKEVQYEEDEMYGKILLPNEG